MGVRAVAALAGALSLGQLSCQTLLGIDDTHVGSDGGSGQDGTSGELDFTLAILPASVTVPFNGQTLIDVEVTRTGGFDGAVTVDAATPPNPSGLTATATVIPAGQARASVPVGASGGLSIGTTFTLTLRGTAGALVRSDEAAAEVTGLPGTLDTTFATNGIFQVNPGSDGGPWVGLHVLGDDILVTGDQTSSLGPIHAATAKITQDGVLDATWNGGAVSTTQWCSCTNDFGEFHAIGVQTTGLYSIVMGSRFGTSSIMRDIAVIRYSPSGGPGGAIFGNGGKNLIDLNNSEDSVSSGLVLADDRIVVVGATSGMHMVALLDESGYLDTSFAGSGWVASGASTNAVDVAIDSLNRLVVVSNASADFQVLRYTLLGQLDTTFSDDGIARGGTTQLEDATAVAVYPDRRILVAGSTDFDNGGTGDIDFFVARLTESGDLDPTFGTGGIAYPDLAEGTDNATDVLLLADGRIVVIGSTSTGTTQGPIMIRLRDDGALDPTFGEAGVARPQLGAMAYLQRIAASPDGRKIYVTGQSSSFPTLALLARIWM